MNDIIKQPLSTLLSAKLISFKHHYRPRNSLMVHHVIKSNVDIHLNTNKTWISCLFFCRTCKLSNSYFTMASVDILYIDITRRWSGSLPDARDAGKKKHTRRSPPQRELNLHNKTRCGGQRAGCPPDTEPITCSQIIACQSLSDSLRHRAAIIEMRRDHNVTGKRVSGMNNSDFAPCEECLRVEADGWRSHGPGWNGLYGGDCGLNSEWAHTYSGRPESECVIPVKPHLRIYWKQGIKLEFLVLF